MNIFIMSLYSLFFIVFLFSVYICLCFEQIVFTCVYETLRVVSFLEIQFNKVMKMIEPFVSFLYSKLRQYGIINECCLLVDIDNNGNIEQRYFKIVDVRSKNPKENHKENNRRYIYIHKNFIEINDSTELNYELSNIKFMMVNLEYTTNGITKEYNIDLNEPFNHFVVGNRFDSLFFKYQLKNVNHVELNDSETFTYKLTILDHNADMKMFTEKDSITIFKDDYFTTRI